MVCEDKYTVKWLIKEKDDYYRNIRSHLSALLPSASINAGLAITFEGKIMRAIGIDNYTYYIDELFSPSASEKEIAEGIYKEHQKKMPVRQFQSNNEIRGL